MAALLQEILVEARAWSVFEAVAVLYAIAYLVLAIRQNIWCWFCAAASTACYVILFMDARLYMESALNVFYLGMAGYGWYVWMYGSNERDSLPVIRWPLHVHAWALAAIALLALLSGYLLARYTDAAWPYIDSATTWAAVWATFLVARKVLENWWYWLVIDSVSIVIYWSRELPLTALLFVFYVMLIPVGLLRWRQAFREQAAQ